MKESNPNCETVQERKNYYKRLSESDRQSINYPIQHTGALCSMTAQIIFFNTLKAKDWLFKVLITVTPYDEINCEAPEEIAEEVTDILHKCMVKAGSYYCTKCKLDAEVSRHKLCKEDYEFNGKKIMSKGDIIATMGENIIVNLKTKESFKTKELPKDYSKYLDDNGPLPTYWVH